MRINHFLNRLHRDDAGAMSVEKILILAIISVPILILLYAFKTTITGWFTKQQGDLTDKVNTDGG